MSVVYHVADLFAGAGGTSTGMLRAIEARGGLAQLVAVNHWPVAVATHTANHGAAQHYCMSLETAEPEDLVPGRKLHILCASPECVYFSRARGGKPVNDQRRSGADWVLRWLEQLDVDVLLVENVEEFMGWGDVDANGRPIKRKNGRLFLAWLKRLEELGYRYDFRILNAADYGDVTTRKRFFLIARKDGRPIRWPTPTHCKGGKTDAFGTLAPWRAAREIIDWSDLDESLFGRKQPLSLKTRLRIGRGAQKFWGLLAPLYIRLLDLPGHDEERLIAGTSSPIGVTYTLAAIGLRDAVTSSLAEMVGSHPNLARLLGAELRHGVALAAGACFKSGGSQGVEPFLAPNTENAVPKSTSEPFGTFTTIPGIYLTTPTAQPFVFANRNNAVPVGMDQPAPTFTTATGGGSYLVSPDAEPFVIGQQSDSAARSVLQPVMAITTGGVLRAFTPIATPIIDQYYATGVADSVNDPLSTATTKPRHALVTPSAEPIVLSRNGHNDPNGRVRPVTDPTASITASGSGSGYLVTPIAGVILPGFGERTGQAPRVHDIDEPAPTVNAQGHLHLATATVELPADLATVDPRRLVVIDGVLHLLGIRFRMLKWEELAAATGFPSDYVFVGPKTDIVRQIGNAVPVNLATALVGAILDPEEAAAEVAS